tara:strand:- start:370 stop:561 length:192 start_codon:yes stop_codon:yes gene_type:complete
MTSRKEDELDLTAMSIADMVKNSDNLRVPRNPERVLDYMIRVKETRSDVVEWGWRSPWKDGAA